MNYQDALKKVKAEKKSDGYLSFKFHFGYGQAIVLPYKDGVQMLQTLATAEFFKDNYGKAPTARQLGTQDFEVRTLSQQEYEQYKVGVLLNLSLGDIIESARAAAAIS